MITKKSMCVSVLVLLGTTLIFHGPRQKAVRPATKVQISQQYGKLPLSFEMNQGQTDAGVNFLSRGKGYTLYLGPTEAVLGLHKPGAPRRSPHRAVSPELTPAGQDRATSQVELRMQLLAANPSPRISGRQELPGKSNYFIGNDPAKWRTNIPNYAKVEYQDVYPGVDLVYYGNGRQLEHDFVVKPGADPHAITMGFPSAGKLSLNARGDLDVDTGGEVVTLQAPVIYQTGPGGRHSVGGRYALKGRQQVGFEVEAYDPAETLIIDPVLVYSTYVGGSNEDFGTDIAVDSSGAAYIVGQTLSTNYPVTSTALQTTFIGPAVNDGFITKLTPDGSALAYSTYIGGASSGTTGTEVIGVAVDGAGNAYVTGDTDAAYPATTGAFQTTMSSGTAHSFVTKLNSTGSALLYSTFLGGDSFDIGYSIAVDAAGEAYVAGETFSGNFPVTAGNIVAYHGGSDAFVTKMNGTGTALVFSTLIGTRGTTATSGDSQGRGIVLDSAGSAYIAGQTTSTDFFTTAGAFQTTYQGGPYDAILFKLTSTGALVYSTLVGATGFDQGRAVAVDPSGNAYMTGQTYSADFPTTAGAFQTVIGGVGSDRTGCSVASPPLSCADAFLIKMNATGTAPIFSTFLGGGGEDQGDHGCGADSLGNVYVTGFTHSTNFPLGASPIQSAYQGGGYDAFVAKFGPTGAMLYSTYLGGNFTDSGRALAVLSPGVIYVMGYTSSTTFPTTAGAFQRTNASISPAGFESFVTKISDTTTTAPIAILSMPTPFTSQAINTTSAAKAVTLSNTGTADLTFTSIATTGDFAQTNNCVSPIAAGGGCTINVTFTPTAASLRTGFVSVTDNAIGSPHSAVISGTGAAPVVSLSTPAAFASQPVGSTSAAQAVTLTNTGNLPLTFTSIATTGDFAQTNNCVSPMAAAASCTISVTFTPTAAGTRTGTISVTDNAAGSPQSTALTGTGTSASAPVASLSTPTAFGGQSINTTSAAQAVTLTNTGNAPLIFTSIATTGDFAQTNTCVSPMAAASTCTISVTFTPTAAGTRTGTLSVTDNAAGSPQSTALTGTGAAPLVSLTTPTAYASQAINTTSAAKSVTFKNTGTAPLTFTSIATTGDFAQTNPCVSPLAAASSCIISVTFTPTAGGVRTGTLTVTDNAAGSPHSVALSGTGNAAPVASLSTPTAFGGQLFNTPSAAQTVTLTNTGTADLIFTSIATIGDFAQTNTCVSPLAALASCAISVTFTPTGNGTRPGTLSVFDNAAGSPQSVALSGTGTRPVVSLTTPTAFGSVPITTTSAVKPVTLTNTGTGPLTITSIAVTGDYAQTNDCVSPVAAGTFCTISVTFSPTVTGTRLGVLSVTDNAATSPQTKNLTGTGGAAPAPLVTLSTPTAFSSQPLTTTSAAKAVTVTNTGNGPLTVTNIAITGDFAQTNDCVSPLAAAAICTISVTFTPTATGTRNGTLTVTDNASGSPHIKNVTGTGAAAAAPIASVSTPTAFGSQAINTTSAAQPVTLTNTGNAPLNFTSIATSGDFAQTNNCVSPLAAAASCTIGVTFTPTANGTRTGTLSVTDDAAGSPQSKTLTGTATGAPAPVAGLSTPAAFASQVINTTSAAKAVTLTNTGNAALSFTSIATSGDFAQTSNCVSPLAAAASCTISVTFTPTVVGPGIGSLTVTDNAAGSPHSVTLSGTGAAAAPAVSLSTPTAFAGQVVNTTSAAQAVTLTNTGNGPLTLSSIATSGDFAQTNNCVSPLAAAGSCTISVTFTPTASGTRSGSLTVADNAAGSPHGVTLTGTGTSAPAPVVSLSTPTAFASQVINTTSAAKAVTLTNTGNAPLTLTSITASGDFAQINNCVSPLAAAGSCTINVTFTPTVTGPDTGALTVTDNAAGSPHSVTLTGTGTATPAPAVSLSTPSAFASQAINTSSAAKAVTLTNTGNSPLTLSSITTSGDYAQTSTCGASLAAATSCTINVTFTPTATGTRTGSLTVIDNAAGSPHSVTLSGTGTSAPAPAVSLSTPSAFASQAIGATSAAKAVTLTNTGNGPLTLSSITTSGDFAQINNCVSPLAAAGSCTINVTFTPTVIGPDTGSLTVTDNAAGSPHSVTLSGTGAAAAPVMSLSTPTAFASQAVNTTSVAKPVTLTNTGNAPLTLSSITTSGDFAQINNCVSPLAAAGSCTINVTFTPTVTGTGTGTLTVIDNAAGSPHSVTLSGTGVTTVQTTTATAGPSQITFGMQKVGSTSSPRTVTLTNTGTAPLNIVSIAMGTDFVQTNTCGSTVPVGGACTISIGFKPTAGGPRSGSLTITDNATASPQTVTLAGFGLL